MSCDNARNAILLPKVNGKHPKPLTYLSHVPYEEVFNRLHNDKTIPKGSHIIQIKCGKCKGCKLAYASQYTVRLMHELHTFPDAMFLTLTYDEENLPTNGSLIKKDLSLFMERLRHHFEGIREIKMPDGLLKKPIRAYSVGEYGDINGRPHYHSIMFNFWFPDALQSKQNKQGDWLYTSALLDKIWGKGLANFSRVTAETCGYVARYTQKKLYGQLAEERYRHEIVDSLTGEILGYENITPEFSVISTRPGIGWFHYQDHAAQIHGLDFTTVSSKKGVYQVPVPRYYDKLLKKTNEAKHDAISTKRLNKMTAKDTQDPHEKSAERIQTKAFVRDARTKAIANKRI